MVPNKTKKFNFANIVSNATSFCFTGYDAGFTGYDDEITFKSMIYEHEMRLIAMNFLQLPCGSVSYLNGYVPGGCGIADISEFFTPCRGLFPCLCLP